MIGGKAAVLGRVPVLRGHHQVELGLDAVDDLDDPIALRHRQRTAGAEVVLHVNDNQRFHPSSDQSSKRNPCLTSFRYFVSLKR